MRVVELKEVRTQLHIYLYFCLISVEGFYWNLIFFESIRRLLFDKNRVLEDVVSELSTWRSESKRRISLSD